MGSLRTLLSLPGSEGKAIEVHRHLDVYLRLCWGVGLVLDIAATKQSGLLVKRELSQRTGFSLPYLCWKEGPTSRDSKQLS